MKKLKSFELRELYLEFFKSKGHAIIPSASLIPENDPTVLFTTAGMHPLVPYLMGQKHPEGNRLTNCQKCVRTGDIEEVGDSSHSTFFEMLGNWSLGDYFKKEAIEYSWEFLTSSQWLNIEKEKLYFTCFAGDDDAPKDEESASHWMSHGVSADHIFFLSKKDNWWGPAGLTGPCGPDSEMFIDTGAEKCGAECNPSCSCGKYLEIWNDVFMQYNKTADGTFEPLSQKNVDTGMGLDRTIAVLQGVSSVYETDVYEKIIQAIENISGRKYKENEDTIKSFRIIGDHVRCATFMIGDQRGITPSNVDQGYVLRRLIRRAVRFMMNLGIKDDSLSTIAESVIDTYSSHYPELEEKRDYIVVQIKLEEERFSKTLVQGIREFERLIRKLDTNVISGKDAFKLYDTFGFPIEISEELAAENGLTINRMEFEQAFEEHQKKSSAGAEQRFKGGLADNSAATTNLHSATHLLQAALRQVLGDEIFQRGSNITADRLRFDFTFPRKVTKEELDEVEKIVNDVILAAYPVSFEEMTVDDAKKAGAIGIFDSKYGEKVKVYSFAGFSKEICGGPHVENTNELGEFKIKKEQASSAGVRRIRAILL